MPRAAGVGNKNRSNIVTVLHPASEACPALQGLETSFWILRNIFLPFLVRHAPLGRGWKLFKAFEETIDVNTSEACPALQGLETIPMSWCWMTEVTSEACPALQGLETLQVRTISIWVKFS